jgi:hypothetical protein
VPVAALGLVMVVRPRQSEDVELSEPTSQRLSYRAYTATRVLSLVMIAGCIVAVFVALVSSSKPWGNRIGGAAIFLVGVPVVYVMLLRPGLDVDERHVTVRTGAGTTIRFPTADLDHVEGGMLLRLHRRSGQVVSVRAISDTNVTLLLHRSGRTERVAAEINAFLKGQGQPPAQVPPTTH